MSARIIIIGVCLYMFLCIPLTAQTHTSVQLENQIYYILEQAEIKGLCVPLSGVRPYTRSVIVTAINEILASENTGRLSGNEREILEQYLVNFSESKKGIDWRRGVYHGETTLGKNDFPLSVNVGLLAEIEGSAGLYSSFQERYFGTEVWLGLFLNGDIGNHISLEISGDGGFMLVPRKELGTYLTFYDGFDDGPDSSYQNQEITVYSEPLTHFPYAYKKRWDASVHHLNDVNAFRSWPDSSAYGYRLLADLTSSFLENKFIMRVGRLSHEWSSTSFGSSLALNQMARPFLGVETEFNPVSWLGFATMTGFLEFFNTKGEKASGMTFQNAYSITMIQLKYKNYLFLDIGETVIWPKRFELGYMFPLISTLVYKGFVGDFDNLGVVANIKAQYPGVGNVWFSLYGDEARAVSNARELDRTMIAWQAGANFSLPFLSFSSFKASYTKVNPYTYTHTRVFTPWYGTIPMETSYTNNGVSLGYYLPPNSDEILARFQTAPVKNLMTYLQYQMIRHGADFGSNAVDGSNLLSELDPDGRDGSNPVLKRFFLHDGAYQWSHIVRLGAEWKLAKLPLAFYGEGGINYSYFTNTAESANSGAAHPYSVVDTSEYPKSTGFIIQIGIKIFPR